METGTRQDGLRTFPSNSVPSEPRREAPEQHTPSHGPIRNVQARDPAASPITHAVPPQVEPQSRAATPITQPVKPTKIDASTTPIASYEALQRQHERRQSRTPVAPQQTFQPTQARLITAPYVSLETQHENRTDSGSPKIAITRPTPSFVASPTFPTAVPQERSPMPETRPQKVQNGTTAPVLSTKTREDPGGSAMSTPLQPPGSCAKARQWIEAQRHVTPPPLPEGDQELRVSEGAGTGLSIEAGLTSTPTTIPDTLGNGASAPTQPEARDPVAHATSPQTKDSEPDTNSHDVVYTCDACKKLVMHYDMIQCDRCASVQYCSHACKRGQRMFHVPHCVGRNHMQSSSQPETTREDPLLSGEVDLSANPPDLTEEFPCFTCEGIKEHQPDCFIVGKLSMLIVSATRKHTHKACSIQASSSSSFIPLHQTILTLYAEFRSGPRPEYTSAMLAELADQAKHFDPEQWREHQNPVEPDPEPYEEVLAQSNEIIKKEESYLNDPFLQVVPDRVLPLMWALRTAPNIEMKFMNE